MGNRIDMFNFATKPKQLWMFACIKISFIVVCGAIFCENNIKYNFNYIKICTSKEIGNQEILCQSSTVQKWFGINYSELI